MPTVHRRDFSKVAQKVKKLVETQFSRLNSLYWIIDEHGKKVRFTMNDSQRQFYENRHWSNITLKDRRRGFSTLAVLMFLDSCVVHANVRAEILDITERDAKDKLKIAKLAWDNLPDLMKASNPLVTDSVTELAWRNGSRLTAGVSSRGGTVHFLLVSELGKISARNTLKAQEIKTGALPAARGGVRIIESTAEGRDGVFHDLVELSRKYQDEGRKLGRQDFKFHFFAWWMGDKNTRNPSGVVITSEMKEYFDGLEADLGITLSSEHRAWYVAEQAVQGDDMKREYPSTPDEAFEASVEGAYFKKQMRQIRTSGRIREVNVDPALPVNTFWDIGRADLMAIWLHQEYRGEHRLVGYFEANDESWAFYRRWFDEFLREHNARQGQHFGPHDLKARQYGVNELKTTLQIADEAGFRMEVVPRIERKGIAIEYARRAIPNCYFDAGRCAVGLEHLEAYSRRWNDRLGMWMDEPLHNEHSHCADSFMTFGTALASGKLKGQNITKRRKPRIISNEGNSWATL